MSGLSGKLSFIASVVTAVLVLASIAPPARARALQDTCLINSLNSILTSGPKSAAPYLDPGHLKKLSRTSREAGQGEPMIVFSSFESARNYSQHFPLFEKYGFELQDYRNWERVVVRLERSSFFGKTVGWERKLPNGDVARYRFDYEPDMKDAATGEIRRGRGAHFNIELFVTNENGHRETLKFAAQVLCGGNRVCTEAESRAYLRQFGN